jgi:hypothetical protein
MNERRIFIYKDAYKNTICRRVHDTSLLQSLPRVGDMVYDELTRDGLLLTTIAGTVRRIEFSLIPSDQCVFIYVECEN